MKYFFLSALAVLLFLAACNNKLKIDTSEFSADESFSMKIDEIAKMKDTDLQLRLTGIPEDSRCPEDVSCIWEGQVRLFLDAAVTGNKKSLEYKIEKSKMGRISQSFEGYSILVEDVQPLPQSGIRIAPEDYVVKFKVSSRQ